MKMIDTETGHEMVEVSGHDKKEYVLGLFNGLL